MELSAPKGTKQSVITGKSSRHAKEALQVRDQADRKRLIT